MKRRKKSQDYYSLSKQKMIGAAGGIFEAVLGAVLFIVSTISIFVIDYGSNWRRVIVPVFGVILFGACVFYGFAMLCAGGGKSQSFKNFLAE